MRLNLQVLKDELAPTPFEHHFIDGATTRMCAYALPYVAGEPLGDVAVYVADAAELPERPKTEGHVSIIIVGEPPAAYRKRPFNLLWCEAGVTDARDLLVRVTRVFGKYEGWSHSIHRVIEGSQQLRDIGLVSEPFFENPIMLEGADGRVLFHVTGPLDRLTTEDYDAYLKDYGDVTPPLPPGSYLPMRVLEQRQSAEGICLDVAEGPTATTLAGREHRLLFQNLGERGARVGRIVIDELYHPFTDRDYTLTDILADFVLRAMRSAGADLRARPNDINYVLERFLAHQLLDERRIEAAAVAYGWDVFDRYLCVTVASVVPEQARERLGATATSLAAFVPDVAYVLFDGRLVVVANLTRAGLTDEEMLRRLAPTFVPGVLAVGVSAVFGDLKNTYYFYGQAVAATRLGGREAPDEAFWRYEDYLLADMLRRIRLRQIPAAFVPSGLARLMEYDEREGTSLVELLRTHLDRDRNVTHTARDLYMNRSTTIRHLDKISEVSGLNLDDPDVRLALGIALRLTEG